MNTLKTAMLVALFLVMPGKAMAQAATTDDATELAEARSILAIMFPPAEREVMFATMIQQLLAQARQAMPQDAMRDPGVATILNRYLDDLPDRLAPLVNAHLPKIIDATAVAYTNEFSLQELVDIRGFAQTPSGQRYLRASTKMIGDPAVAAANTAYLTELQAQQLQMQQQLMAELQAYARQNPEAAARSR